jgi:hypothetical protein
MKTKINQSKKGKSLLVTFYEGFSTYTITVPLPYAIRFFAEGLQLGLEALSQDSEMQSKLDEREGEKSELQEYLRRSVKLFDELLRTTGR